MNIYDLEKSATPKPWIVAEESCTRGTAVWGGSDGAVNLFGGCDKWPENMMLAAHCRNHFMRALDALKAERAYHSEQKRIGRADQLDEVIKQLEHV